MIRIVKILRVVNADNILDERAGVMIPASGTFQLTENKDESGRFETSSLSARINPSYKDIELLRGPVILKVEFDNGEIYTMGSADVPVYLRITTTNTCALSAEYTRPA